MLAYALEMNAEERRPSEAPRVWVCVPTYNEVEQVEALALAVLDSLGAAEIDGHVLVIDDSSPDGTGAVADRLAEREPRVTVLHRPAKQGIGPAYIAGFQQALELGADLVVSMDCDFSHDPAALPGLIAAAREADLVLGSRYVHGGSIVDWSRLRRIVSRAGSGFARRALDLQIADLTGGFKCYRREVLEAVGLDRIRTTGYGFQIETTYLAEQAGFTIVEIPITFRDRRVGSSKMSIAIAGEAAVAVLGLRSRVRARERLALRSVR